MNARCESNISAREVFMHHTSVSVVPSPQLAEQLHFRVRRFGLRQYQQSPDIGYCQESTH